MQLPVIVREEVPLGEEAEFVKFSNPPRFAGGPFDPQPPTRTLRRDLDVNIDLPLPASVAARTEARRDKIRLWIIEDPDDPSNGRTFPSPIIRTVQGDIVHATVGFKLSDHTIHWHGLNPTPLNDGVGHTSFEATSEFVYQFATHQAGTYFYHCHKNTVLHFEMGLYGLLVVDPRNPNRADSLQATYFGTGNDPQGRKGLVAANLNAFSGMFPGYDATHYVVPYHVEALWAVDEFDSIWHELNHDAFMQARDRAQPMAANTFSQDGILNDFRPDVFLITGVVSEPTTRIGVQPEVGAVIRKSPVAVTANRGQTILIRLLNAGYTIQEYTLGVPAIVIAADGNPWGVPPSQQYSTPQSLRANEPFRLTSARRVDLLVKAPATAQEIPFTVRWYDWIRGPDSQSPKLFHVAKTVIKVV
jgi:FtsP/CotA-like multicopper oxidase with cupredoxin domain